MSVATAMYSLKPVLDKNVTINRDSCMYSMKNIHRSEGHASLNGNVIVADVTEKVINFLKVFGQIISV